MRRQLAAVLAFSALVLTSFPAQAQGQIVVELADTARIVDGGQAVVINVTVSCPRHHNVQEAFLYVNQDGFQGEFAFIRIPRCEGKNKKPVLRTYTITAHSSEDFNYHPGDAFSSAFVLITDRKDRAFSEGDSETITLS